MPSHHQAADRSRRQSRASQDAIDAAADRLATAYHTGVPCPPVRDLIGAHDVAAAYAVQTTLTRGRLAAGRHIVGHKVGLTSSAVQAQLGVDRPDFGVLFDDMALANASAVDIRRLMQPRIEAEIAFVLSHDIRDPDVTADSIRSNVEYAVPALEIVGSRVAQWDITYGDTVADNASSGVYVLGDSRRSLDEFEPRAVAMTMWTDDVEVSIGSGDACLGDPLNALAWLARTAVGNGEPLRAGYVVLSGALGPMAPVRAGTQVRAHITDLGTVEATFTSGGTS